MITTELAGVVAEHVAAVNALDTDAIMATFAPDAYANDARREFAGLAAIREVVLSNYFSVRDGKIVSLIVVFNQAAAYDRGKFQISGS